MSEKKVGKRLLTWVLVLVMTLSLLPLNVLADEANPAEPGKVTAKKECSGPDATGNYTITLTVQGNPVPSTDTMTTPANADVVLVVDNSGSMSSSVGYPCNTPKGSFRESGGDNLIAFKWETFSCPNCGAKYYRWSYYSLISNDWKVFSDGVPDTCTGEKGETVRIDAAKAVSRAFADSILKGNGNKIAIIGFAHGDRDGGTDPKAIKVAQPLTNDKTAVENAIDLMNADGGTNYTAALDKAYTYLKNRSDKDGRPGYVIFISDGAPGLSGESQSDPKWNGSEQATKIKQDGYTLYTVGIALDSDAAAYLKGMASADQDKHFINVTETNYEAQLKETLLQWADKIKETPTTKPAGTKAVLTDVINTKQFEYVEGSATRGLTVGEDSEGNKTVTWNIGEIPEKDASVSFKIKAWAGVWGDGIHTNENVTLTYTDAKDELATMGKDVIGDPTVNIPAPQVTLTFDANGGSWTDSVAGYTMGTGNKTASVTGEVGTLTPQKIDTDPVNASHDFTGWYQDEKCTTPVSWGYQIPLRANATLYAGWTPRQADTFSCKIVQHFIDADGKSSNIDKFTSNAIAKDTPISDLIAEYAKNQGTYWYNAFETKVNGATITANQKLTGNTVIDLYYYLDIWNDEDNTISDGDGIPDMYQVLVKFESANPLYGTVTGTTTQVFTGKDAEDKYVTSFDVTPDMNGITCTPTAPQYKFLKWTRDDKDVEDPGAMIKDVPGGSTIVFQAQWDTNKYTVTWKNWNGDELEKDENVEYGATPKYDGVTPTKPATAQFTYTFTGWMPEVSEVTGDAIYTATYTETTNKYTVTYNSNGGTEVKPETVTYGNKATKPADPTKNGYTFAGWYTEEQLTNTYDFDTPVIKDITLYAKWEAIYVPYYPPVPPTVKIEDDDALGLNTTDHFAYIVGYGNGEVRPQNNITRAEVATIFFRLLTDDVRDENLTKTNRYSDVAATSWYNTAVSTLSSMGIITGYPDGTFRPNAAITRAEFAAIAARFDNDGDKTAAKFSDIATHWARDEISIAYNNGWINGYPDGTFGPQRDITRAETMTLVNRVLNRQPETEDDLLPNMTVWTDNANPNAWYYLAVQEATNSHYYKFKTNSKYEKWTELRETRDWTQLEK